MRFLCLLFLSLSASLTHAQDWFEIEVIIFEHKNAQLNSQSNFEDNEHWSSDLDLSWPTPLLELEPAVERAEPVEIFPPFEELVFEQRRMNNDSYALRVRDPYELLWHKAWKAPLLPEGQAPWILVQAGEELGEHYRLEGAIRIHLSRYLHLSTNLWLTEVSGNAITEDVLNTDSSEKSYSEKTIDNTEISLPDSRIEDIDTRSEFDWSQLPELGSVRWGCNHIRESWPEDNRLLPADYYEDPAPADWYYPFGCRTLSEYTDRDIPYFVNIPTSDRYAEAELQINYPELFVQPKAEQGIFDPVTQEAESPTNVDMPTESKEAPFSQAHSINTQALLENIEVVFMNEDGSYNSAETELMLPAPRVHYPVKEIIHIQGKRRMRSGEFHYIDHPKVGVLAIIHPVEKPELVLEPQSEPEDVVN